MTDRQAAMEHLWLHADLIASIRKQLCIGISCTPCGAHEFRNGLLDAVARATDQPRTPHLDERRARATAEAPARVEPVQNRADPDHEVIGPRTLRKAVRLVIADVWSVLVPFPLGTMFENTWAGNVLARMQSHPQLRPGVS